MSLIVNEFRIFHVLPDNIKQNIKLFYVPHCDGAFCVTKNDQVYVVGNILIDKCGYSEDNQDESYLLIDELCNKNIVEFLCSDQKYMFARSGHGMIFGWGDHFYALGCEYLGEFPTNNKPEQINYFNNKDIIEISCGDRHCLFLSKDGLVYNWGVRNCIVTSLSGNPVTTFIEPFLLGEAHGLNKLVRKIYCYHHISILLTIDGLVYISNGNTNEWKFKVITQLNNVHKMFLIDEKSICILQTCGKFNKYLVTNFSDEEQQLKLDRTFNIQNDLIDNVYQLYGNIILPDEQGVVKLNMIDFSHEVLSKYTKIFDYFLFENQSTYKTIHIKNNGISVESHKLINKSMTKITEIVYSNIADFYDNYWQDNSTLKKFRTSSIFPETISSNVRYYHQIGGYNSTESSAIFVMKDNNVFGFGFNRYGCLGLGHNRNIKQYTPIPELCGQNIVEFFNGRECMFARSDTNVIYGWGQNDHGKLGGSECSEYWKPRKLIDLNDKNILQICVGFEKCLALSSEGILFEWGGSEQAQSDYEQKSLRLLKKFELDRIVDIHAEYNSYSAVTMDGKAFIWGNVYDHDQLFTEKCSVTYLIEPKLIKYENIFKIKYKFPETVYLGFDCYLNLAILTKLGELYVFYGDEQRKCYQAIGIVDFEFSNHEDAVIMLKNDTVFKFEAKAYERDIENTYFSNFYEYLSVVDKEIKNTIHITSDGFLMRHKLLVNEKYQDNTDEKLLVKSYDNIFDNKFQNSFTDEGSLGRGSFGYVFRVKGLNSGKFFAVKRIRIRGNLEDIKREIEIMFKMDFDFVVKYYNSWTEGKVIDRQLITFVYIQMELCSQNLQDLINSINLAFDERFKTIEFFIRSSLFVELIECLNHLHSFDPKVIHRDLKPQNVLVTDGRNGRFLKLCDFGLSKFFETHHNSAGVGTTYYRAPEVKKVEHDENKREYDTKCDIYSLGVIATQLFNINDDLKSIKLRVNMNHHVKSYSKFNFLEKFRKLFELISSMISKKPEERPNCEELLRTQNEWTLNSRGVKNDDQFACFNLYDNIDGPIVREIFLIKINK